eukprot:m.144938 g.144938  ORF g.144938 m.144938 type:complete len:568 (-) comp17210_c0_seq1:1011-2714(-)
MSLSSPWSRRSRCSDSAKQTPARACRRCPSGWCRTTCRRWGCVCRVFAWVADVGNGMWLLFGRVVRPKACCTVNVGRFLDADGLQQQQLPLSALRLNAKPASGSVDDPAAPLALRSGAFCCAMFFQNQAWSLSPFATWAVLRHRQSGKALSQGTLTSAGIAAVLGSAVTNDGGCFWRGLPPHVREHAVPLAAHLRSDQACDGLLLVGFALTDLSLLVVAFENKRTSPPPVQLLDRDPARLETTFEQLRQDQQLAVWDVFLAPDTENTLANRAVDHPPLMTERTLEQIKGYLLGQLPAASVDSAILPLAAVRRRDEEHLLEHLRRVPNNAVEPQLLRTYTLCLGVGATTVLRAACRQLRDDEQGVFLAEGEELLRQLTTVQVGSSTRRLYLLWPRDIAADDVAQLRGTLHELLRKTTKLQGVALLFVSPIALTEPWPQGKFVFDATLDLDDELPGLRAYFPASTLLLNKVTHTTNQQPVFVTFPTMLLAGHLSGHNGAVAMFRRLHDHLTSGTDQWYACRGHVHCNVCGIWPCCNCFAPTPWYSRKKQPSVALAGVQSCTTQRRGRTA